MDKLELKKDFQSMDEYTVSNILSIEEEEEESRLEMKDTIL